MNEQREKVMAKAKELGDVVKRANLAVRGAIEELYEEQKGRTPAQTQEAAAYLVTLCATTVEAIKTMEKFIASPNDPAWYPRTFP